MKRLISAVFVLLSGCATAPMNEPDPVNIVTSKSQIEVGESIAAALVYKNWHIESTELGRIVATMGHKESWWVSIEIPYTDHSYQIKYLSSGRYKYDPETNMIDNSYNPFIAELDTEIQIRIYNRMVVPGL